MQGLLLVWRGCLFAGMRWMCSDYEAVSLPRSFPRSRDRDKPVYAGFYQRFTGLSRRLFIVMPPNLGNAAADSADSLLVFFFLPSLPLLLIIFFFFFNPLFSFIYLTFIPSLTSHTLIFPLPQIYQNLSI